MIRLRCILLPRLLLTLLLLVTPSGYAGSQEPRPLGGRGLLIFPHATSTGKLRLYELPGIRLIGAIPARELPTLAPFVTATGGETVLAVLSSHEGWLRIVRDSVGRNAWVELQEGWQYRSWEHYLPGRTIRLLPGFKESRYRLRSTPAEKGEPVGAAITGTALPVRSVHGDWIRVETAGQSETWLRWRDGDGRLLISVE